MCCEYCGQKTENPPERIENRKVWVCDKVECQIKFYDEEEKAHDSAQRYDDWVTRTE